MDLDQIERLGPMEIERRSFEIISDLGVFVFMPA